MQRSIYAGDTMVGEGRVVRSYTDEAGARVRHLVDLELTVKNQDGGCAALRPSPSSCRFGSLGSRDDR
jgi:hypothetical protein